MAALGLSKSLQVESLEERLVMTSDPLLIPAGNVAAYMNQGTLEIRGDALNNNIDITQVTDGQFQISGINGTLINGRSTPLRVSGVVDLDTKLRDGNDTVTVNLRSNGIVRNVTIDMGMGQSEKVIVQGGQSINNLNVHCRGRNSLDFRTGGGSLFVYGETKIVGGNSTTQGDRIDLFGYYKAISIETGEGDDFVRLGTTTGFSSILRLEAANVNVKMGNGNDQLNILKAKIDALFADLGAGDDSLILSLAQVTARNTRVNGGSGRDTLQERTNTPESPFLVGFEVLPPS